ncbi:hypothetical protein BOTBODRAFT_26050 [Botryobasidium botryosum FD-172 SS1]|uniref:TBP-associated factor 12 n=1 Tax=Botryobasidium botryosum (strain FD-172 SS1) TaxID=930990 RepID=A0A067N174_BOTB1|nr:hypothetical protein BOTBODRAFT_26050 [Botryobasidium botryosum FD-172 SS1]
MELASKGGLGPNHITQFTNILKRIGIPANEAAATTTQFLNTIQSPSRASPAPAAANAGAAGLKRKSPMPDSTGTATPTGRPAGLPATTYQPIPQQTWGAPSPRPPPVAMPSYSTIPRPVNGMPLPANSANTATNATNASKTAASTDPVLKRDHTTEQASRQMIRDLVSSMDPEMKIEREVEDMLFDIASEFVESVTNFSCRLARHRGSDTLDVKDLQLHLERNHNIRVPGFGSDDTRVVSATPSNIPPPPPTAVTGKNKAAEKTPAGLRTTRLNAIKQSK